MCHFGVQIVPRSVNYSNNYGIDSTMDVRVSFMEVPILNEYSFIYLLLQDVLYQIIRVEVDIVDLFEYAEGSRRNWVEGNQIFKNDHVIIAGVTKIEGDQIHVFCSCLRGSNPSEPPRQVNIVTSTLFKNWSLHCSCPAGNHRCKHKFACLLFIHTFYYIIHFEMLLRQSVAH